MTNHDQPPPMTSEEKIIMAKCCIIGIVITGAYFCALVYGIALMESREKATQIGMEMRRRLNKVEANLEVINSRPYLRR